MRDHNPSNCTPYVTYLLMLTNIVIFASYSPALSDPFTINNIYLNWAMIPARLTAQEGYYTLLSSMFMHGGWLHLAGNMLFLWIFGDNIESELGHFPYLGFYLLSGLAAAGLHYFSAPDSMVPTVGASGAIAGVMGGYLFLFPKAKVDILFIFIIFFRIFTIPAWILLMLWFGMQFFGGISMDPDSGGVAYWAHAGGFIAGFIFVLPLWIKRGGSGYWQRYDFHPPHPDAIYSQSRIPKVRR